MHVGVGAATALGRHGVSWVLPNLALFDVKAEVVHGVPAGVRRLLYAVAYGVLYMAARAVAGDGGLRTSGSSSENVLRPTDAGAALAASAGVQARPGPQAARCALEPVPAVRYLRSPEAGAAPGTLVRPAGGRPLLDAGAAGVRQHAAAHAGRTRPTPTCTRFSISRRRSIRNSTSPTGSAPSFCRSCRPAVRDGPTWPSPCSRRASRATRRAGSTTRTSASCTTGGAATTSRRAAWFERGAPVPGAPWWLKSMAATTLAAGGDRRNVALPLADAAAQTATTTGCGAMPRVACSNSTRWTSIDELDRMRRARSRCRCSTRRGRGRSVQRGVLRGARSIPPVSRTTST